MTSRANILVQLVCVLAVMAAVHSKHKVKPASFYFKICHRGNQKTLSECVKDSITHLKTSLKNGIPALGLIPIEPLVIPRLEANEGTGSFQISAIMTNLTINGLSNYTATDVNVVLDDKTLNANITLLIPELVMTANYKLNGQILVIPLIGEGNCEMNFTDVVAVSRTKGRVVERNGEEYIDLIGTVWELSFSYEKSRSWFYNLFNGDERLGNGTNNFLNANGEEAYTITKDIPAEAFGQVFNVFSSKVFETYPIKELFLD